MVNWAVRIPAMSRWVGFFVLIISLLLLSACGGGGGGDSEPKPSPTRFNLAVEMISAKEGGRVTVSEAHTLAGTAIEVATQSFSENTFIYIDLSTLNERPGMVGPVIRIRPQTLGLSAPARVTLVYDARDLPEGVAENHLRLARVGQGGVLTDLANVRVDAVANKVTGETRVLGDFVIALPDASGFPQSPVAHAGFDQTVALGERVIVDGRLSSDINGDHLTFHWQMIESPEGSAAELRGTNQIQAWFMADFPGRYVAQLVVSDGVFDSVADTVTVSTENSAPVAHAGFNQARQVGEVVRLDGSASYDVDGDPVSYRWELLSKPLESAAVLTDASALYPSFTIDEEGDYVFRLTVNDGVLNSPPSTRVVSTRNTAPHARTLDDRKAEIGEVISLDASASVDAEGDTLNYRWALTTLPQGASTVLLDADTMNARFTLNQPGRYVAQLIVDDGELESEVDVIAITMQEENTAPVARAGRSQSVTLAETVLLDGTDSFDLEGDELSYRWRLISKPEESTATISQVNIPSPTFRVDREGVYVAQLIVHDGQINSRPDTVVISTANLPPVALVDGATRVARGGRVLLNAADAYDPNGDVMQYRWALLHKPEGSSAAIDDPEGVDASFIADLDGFYAAQLMISDGEFQAEPVSIRIETVDSLFLDPIGPQEVVVGQTLSLQLSTVHAEGRSVLFNVLPLPLQENTEFNAVTGEFRFTPTASQIGSSRLTFTAFDGLDTVSETVDINVIAPPQGSITKLSGRILDAVSAQADEEIPVVGLTVRLRGSDITAVSDARGEFEFANLVGGEVILDFDPSTANPAPDSASYGGYALTQTVVQGIDNVIGQTIYLPRIAEQDWVDVVPTETLHISDAQLGVSLMLSRETAKTQTGGNYDGRLALAEVPRLLGTMLLPDFLQPAQVIALQPQGVVFSNPVPVRFPNLDGLAPGSKTYLWALDYERGEYVIVGLGRVSDDGTEIETVSGGMRGTGWFFMMSPALVRLGDANPLGHVMRDQCQVPGKWTLPDTRSYQARLQEMMPLPVPLVKTRSSEVTLDCGDGHMMLKHVLPSYRSLGQSWDMRFVYNSAAADPQPIVHLDPSVPEGSGVPPLISLSDVNIAGIDYGADPVFYDSFNAFEVGDESVRIPILLDAFNLPSGVYQYSARINSHYPISTVARDFRSDVIVNNLTASPIGAGWSLEDLSRLHPQEDGVLIIEGNGNALHFKTAPPMRFASPSPSSLGLGAKALVSADFNGDDALDLIAIADADELQARPAGAYLFTGRGDGVMDFDRVLSLPGERHHDLGVLDINHDGRDDLLVLSSTENRGVVTLWIRDETQNYQLSGEFSVGQQPTALVVADLDNDRRKDVVVTNGGDQSLSVLMNRGESSFADAIALPSSSTPGAIPQGLIVTDVNGDGDDDLAIAHGASAFEVVVMRGDGEGGFAPAELIRLPQAISSMTSIDVNNDRLDDLVLGMADNDFPTLALIMAGQNQAMAPPSLLPLRISPGEITMGDFNNDNNEDLVVVNAAFQSLEIWLGNGLGQFQTQPVIATGLRNHRADQFALNQGQLLVRDFDQDGRSDIALINSFDQSATDAITLYLNRPVNEDDFLTPPGERSSLRISGFNTTYTREFQDGREIVYNASGLQTRAEDRFGNRWHYEYDQLNRLIRVRDPVGNETVFSYAGEYLSAVIDPAGRLTKFEHDVEGNLVAIIDPDGSRRAFTYAARHRLVSSVSKNGAVTRYRYDERGRINEVTQPDGGVALNTPASVVGMAGAGMGSREQPAVLVKSNEVEAQYRDANGHAYRYEINRFGGVTKVSDALNRVTVIERDLDNRVIAVDKAGGYRETRNYDESGNLIMLNEGVGSAFERQTQFSYEPRRQRLTSVRDSAGNTTSFTYDFIGALIAKQSPSGARRTFTRDLRGVLLTDRDENGNLTTYEHNVWGNVNTITNALGHVTRVNRDDAGNIESIVRAFGTEEQSTTQYDYDEHNRIVQITDGEGGVTDFGYDAEGNIISLQAATAEVYEWTYDGMNRRVSELDPIIGTHFFSYDRNGNVVETRNERDEVHQVEYDALNRIVLTRDALDYTHRFDYNARGDLAETTDPLGSRKQYVYDVLGRVSEYIDPLGQRTTSSYDERDLLLSETDANGVTKTYEYDEHALLTKVTTPDDIVTFGYDGMGLMLWAEDSDSRVLYDYDELNRVSQSEVIAVASQPAVVMNFEYDRRGNRVAAEDNQGSRFTMSYDLADRQTRLRVPPGLNVGIRYDADGRVAGRDFPDFVVTHFEYDANGHLRVLDYDSWRFRYIYDELGNTVELRDGDASRFFEYDVLKRITSVSAPEVVEHYAYDAAGNRTRSHLSSLYQYNEAHQLLEDDGYTYSYDANGNRIAKVNKVDGQTTRYSWDAFNRLIGIAHTDDTLTSYRYDALGRRIEKNLNGEISHYIYDGDHVRMAFNNEGVIEKRFLHDEDQGRPLGILEEGRQYFFQTDLEGTVFRVANRGNEEVNRYRYDSFGRITESLGDEVSPYRYQGFVLDEESGLFYRNGRYYDADLGRFIDARQ